MEYPYRIQFETTLDELVEVSLRLGQGLKAIRQHRSRSIWAVAIAASLSFFSVLVIGGASSSPAGIIAAGAAALFLGILLGFGYRWLYDRSLARRMRKIIKERLGDRRQWICEIELRDEGAWVRDPSVEIMFNWGEATTIEETLQGIELRFRSGLVLARNRAFATSVDRRAFLDRARVLAAP